MKRLSEPAVNHLVILNMAIGILKVRKLKDVTAKAVNITKDQKVLNQKRKVIARTDSELDNICSLTDEIFPKVDRVDLGKIAKGHTPELIQTIPEKTTNPEILALYLLYINFQDETDLRLDERLKVCLNYDYMSLIITISEEIGLEKDVSDDMYVLASKLIGKVRK